MVLIVEGHSYPKMKRVIYHCQAGELEFQVLLSYTNNRAKVICEERKCIGSVHGQWSLSCLKKLFTAVNGTTENTVDAIINIILQEVRKFDLME